ncbi:MAG: ABC transporter ATP-binding protein [Intestinibacter sp.]
MKEIFFKVENLNVDIKLDNKFVSVINDVNFELEKGKILGIIGESGSGKSVTCTSLMGLLNNKKWNCKGSMKLNSQEFDLSDAKSFEKLRGIKIGMIMQNPMSAFDPLFTIGDHFIETKKAHTNESKDQILKSAKNILSRMRIKNPEKVLTLYPFECSGGMLQRIMIGIAVLIKPHILIADEPTTALDQTVQYEILKIIKELKENGTSIIFISHDLKIVQSVSDYIAVMYGGYIIEKIKNDDMELNISHPYSKALLDSRPKFSKKRLTVLEGTPPTLLERSEGCPFYNRCKNAVNDCLYFDMNEKNISEEHFIRCIYLDGGKEHEVTSSKQCV